jgi:hypothetical protein
MAHPRLTADEVQAATRHLPGGAGLARLLEEKDRNQVFAVGEQAIFKAYLADGAAKQGRKIAALEFLAGRGLPVPRLLGHGIVPKAGSGVPWTLETRVITDHVWPSRDELDTPWGWELHRALGRWLPALHAFGGFPGFGTWHVGGPATLAGHVLPRARPIRAHAARLGNIPQARGAPSHPGRDVQRRHRHQPHRPRARQPGDHPRRHHRGHQRGRVPAHPRRTTRPHHPRRSPPPPRPGLN